MAKGTILDDFLATIPGSDGTELHADVAGEIAGIAAKAAPVPLDTILINDSEDSDEPASLTLATLFATPGTIAGLTAKTTPVAADLIAIDDSAASDAAKKSTVAQVLNTTATTTLLTAKATVVAADLLCIEDSAAASAKKKSTAAEVLNTAATTTLLTAKAVPTAADLICIEDAAAASAKKKSTLAEVALAAATDAFKTLEIAEDAACAILNTTASIELASATVVSVGVVAITTTSSRAGQILDIVLKAASGGGTYTLAVTGGDLTFNAANEYARVRRNAANSAWVYMQLTGATVV